ncbi:MAG: glycoside hydrolase family 5 protein [Oscillospiraceae bacterium]
MKKAILLILAAAMMLSAASCASDPSVSAEAAIVKKTVTETSATVSEAEKKSDMRDITTMELVKEMGYGINLGNTFEACGDWINGKTPNDFQQAWGSPVITKEIIQTYADAGFGVLRIPVAWSNMISDDGKYTIAPEYIDRVKEAVDWTLDSGMYAIINIHWDGGWVNEFPENKEESMKRFTVMWTQIAAAFEDYPDTLMFEGQNEELGWESIWNPWSGTEEQKKESYALVNEVNQAFVDTIRAGGGNNPQRHLLISGYNTGIDRSCDPLFKMPDDPAGRMALSVHYYTPSTLCILDKDASWGKAITEWGSAKDIKELETNMNMLKESYIDKGIPVIVGEYGCFGDNKKREVKENWMLTVSKAMYDIGACPVLWDTPGGECDRENAKFSDPDFIKKLIEPAKKQ